MPETYFVTGATGAQGGAVARALLESGDAVHALCRDTSASAAQALSAAGATLFEGSFTDIEAMTIAARGCSGVFVNVSPTFDDPQGEQKHAANILKACQSAGVRRIVQSSVASVEQYEKGAFVNFDKTSPMASYYANKLATEKLIQASATLGFETWAIVRPSRLLNSYVAPLSNFMFPLMSSKGIIATALMPDLQQAVVDPWDVGKVVRDIFQKNVYWMRVIPISGDKMTMHDIIEAMNAALQEDAVKLEFYGSEEAEKLSTQNPIIASELFLNENASIFSETPAGESLDLEMSTAEKYFKREKRALLAGLGR